MKPIKIFALVTFFSFHFSSASESQLPTMIGSKDFWTKLDWSKVENSTLFTLPVWVQDSGSQFNNYVLLKTAAMPIGDESFEVNLYRRSDGRAFPMMMSLSRKDPGPQSCTKVFEWAKGRYGKPKAVYDGSFILRVGEAENAVMKMVNMGQQFVLGRTIVTASCNNLTSGTDGKAVSGLAGLSFSHSSRVPPMVPMFALRCERQIDFKDGNKPTSASFDLVMDEYGTSVRNSENFPLDNKAKFTANHIKFVIDLRGVKSEFDIDRHTGQIYGVSKSKNDETIAVQTGDCKKVDLSTRKF